MTRVTLTATEHTVLAGAALLGETTVETAVRIGVPTSRVKEARRTAIGKLHARNLPHAVHLASSALAGPR
jgi:DNA-binding CsgD family transcriptional regulator